MAKAIWENTVLAESDRTFEVEGNQYFPPDAIKTEYFRPSDQHTTCPWKGLASYYNLDVNGKNNPKPPGIIRNRSRRPTRSKAMSRSGRV